jgi:hypothetical protein
MKLGSLFWARTLSSQKIVNGGMCDHLMHAQLQECHTLYAYLALLN